jgi:hypothetical protein
MKKAVLAIIIVLTLVFAGYVAAGPYMTLGNLRQGVAAKDEALLAANIDFPALRENLKAQLKASIAKAVAPEPDAAEENDQVSQFKKNLSDMGAEFAEKFAGKMVDALVTPAGMAKIAGNQLTLAPNAQPTPSAHDNDVFLKDAKVAFQSFNTVYVIGPGQEGSDPVKFVLTRQGAKWRLTNILLPLETAPPVDAD